MIRYVLEKEGLEVVWSIRDCYGETALAEEVLSPRDGMLKFAF